MAAVSCNEAALAPEAMNLAMGRPQRWPLLTGALALAGVVVLGAAIGIGGWRPFGSTGPQATGSSSPSPGNATFAANWALADVDPPALGSSEMTDVVFYRGEWIAVGVNTTASVSGGTGEGARIWISKDRRHWEAVADLQSFSGDIYLTSVAVGPTGVVAVGRQDSRAQAWVSADGRRWHAAPGQESLGDGMAMAVEHGPTGYVAVGYTFVLGVGVNAAVWRSSDGLEWRLMPTAEGFEATSLMSIAISHGLEVVVGVTTHEVSPDSAGPFIPGAWSSLDGLNWTRAELPFDESAYVIGVVAAANGFVAVGNGAGPLVWVSDDGKAWKLLEADAFPGAGGAAGLTSVASSGDHLVAMGYQSDGERSWGTIWISDDGSTWRSVAGKELFLGVSLHAVVIGPNGLVAVGSARDPTRDYLATAWYSR